MATFKARVNDWTADSMNGSAVYINGWMYIWMKQAFDGGVNEKGKEDGMLSQQMLFIDCDLKRM